MTSRIYCAVFGCMNSSITNPEITYFRLPGKYERRLQWLQLIRRDDLENKPNFTSYRVCEKHFNLEDVLQSSNRKLLKKNALPLLMLPSLASTDPGVSRKEDKQTQTVSLVQAKESVQSESPRNIEDVNISDNSSNLSHKIEVQNAEPVQNDPSVNLGYVNIPHGSFENPPNVMIKIEKPDSDTEQYDSPNKPHGVKDMNNIENTPQYFALKIKIRRLIIEKKIVQRKNKFLTQQNNSLKKKMFNMKNAFIMLKKKNRQLQKQIANQKTE